ncbi:MAG: sugar transferase [Candidatus Cloacimonadota bacterium]|nr:sugar transferase [Candidatus Cloacimonadota bacterium]
MVHNKLKQFLLLIGDFVVFYGSLFLVLVVRYSQIPTRHLWMQHFWPFTIILAIWVVIFYISELYNLNFAINNRKFYYLSFRSFISGGLLAALFFYLNPLIDINPKTNLALFVIIFGTLFIIWRNFYNWSIKSYLPKEKVAIIGYNDLVEDLIIELRKKPHLGFAIEFVFNDKPTDIELDIPIYNQLHKLKQYLRKKQITTVILASDPVRSEKLTTLLFDCISLKLNFINLSHFYENITGKVPINIINKSWFLENLTEGNKSFYNVLKRIFDLCLSIVLLPIFFVLTPIIALLIKLDSKGPVFFRQVRLGKMGKKVIVIKFRTMRYTDNDFTPTDENDERITGVGRWLRKFRLDELPQIWNVLKGEMSFVGPRPERPELIEKLEKVVPFYRERMLVKPGITGWDQISNEYHSASYKDTMEKLQYDLFYIKNRSFSLDISIILKTITTMLSRKGR